MTQLFVSPPMLELFKKEHPGDVTLFDDHATDSMKLPWTAMLITFSFAPVAKICAEWRSSFRASMAHKDASVSMKELAIACQCWLPFENARRELVRKAAVMPDEGLGPWLVEFVAAIRAQAVADAWGFVEKAARAAAGFVARASEAMADVEKELNETDASALPELSTKFGALMKKKETKDLKKAVQQLRQLHTSFGAFSKVVASMHASDADKRVGEVSAIFVSDSVHSATVKYAHCTGLVALTRPLKDNEKRCNVVSQCISLLKSVRIVDNGPCVYSKTSPKMQLVMQQHSSAA